MNLWDEIIWLLILCGPLVLGLWIGFCMGIHSERLKNEDSGFYKDGD